MLDLFEKYSTDEDVSLLKLNCPIDLGMPAYLSDAFLADEKCLYTAETLVGLDYKSLIEEYRALKGYQFSWGVLSQVET